MLFYYNMEDARLNMNSLYGGGRTKSNSKGTDDKKKKAYSPASKKSSSKKNSFIDNEVGDGHYKDEHYKCESKQELSDNDKWRKQNRILQKELNETKKELELMKKKNTELERRLNL